MSLVNDMLRDLNRRTPVSNKAARVNGTITTSIESKRPRMRIGLIVAGCLLAGLGAGYLYFGSLGVQVVEVPLAVVPVVQETAPPAVVGNSVEIVEETLSANGFTLRILASQPVEFAVLNRSTFGLTLHLDGIDNYARSSSTTVGMSVLQVSNGLDLGIELNEPADFLVYEDAETAGFDIVLTASYRAQEISTSTEPPPQVLATSPAPVVQASTPAVEQVIQPEQSAPAVVIQQAPAPQTAVIAPAPQPQAAPPVQRSSPVRVNRELSLEEQDRNNSQEAVMLVQSGRINEAYQGLLLFISEHPDAHQSRETLATLLLAQGEMGQARSVVDGGLSLVPNYGPFKKIKARLLMQDGASAQALALLRNVPPAVATDPEYHELLASLYQQNSSHDLAVASYQDLLRFNSQQGRWWTGLAISLEALGKNADALASYQAALQTSNLDAGLRQYIQNRIFNLSKQQ